MGTDLIQERLVNDGEETNIGEAAMDVVLSLKLRVKIRSSWKRISVVLKGMATHAHWRTLGE